MRVFLGSGWYFLAAASLLMAAFTHVLKSSFGVPRMLKTVRFAAASLAALVLIRPYAVFYRPAPELPRLAILLDASLYMREGKAAKDSGVAKYVQASDWLEKHLPRLKKAAGLECYAFSDRLYKTACSSFPAAGFGTGTYSESDLGGALSSLAGGGYGAACPDRVWVLTDGLSFSGKSKILPPAGCEQRIDILSVGATAAPRGIVLKDFSGPPFAFAHIPFSLSGSLRVSGLNGTRLELRLKDGAGSVIGTRGFEIAGGDEVLTATFTVSAPSVGRAAYTLCASRGPGQECSASKTFPVSVIREKLRVMYLAGRPSFEYAFLRDYLKNQSGIDLVSFVILRNPEDMPGADQRELSLIPFPVNEIFLRDISHFDVFIMQDFDLRRFALDGNYTASLADFVGKGGGLAVIGGPSAFGAGGYYGMPMFNSILPAEAGKQPDFDGNVEYRVLPAEHTAARLFPGLENEERFWAGAPSLKGANMLGPLRAGAKAVFYYEDPSSGAKSVFSAERRHGKGRVMAIAGPSTWRWKMLTAGQLKYSGLYQSFWSRTLAYLDGSLSLDKVTLEPLPRSGSSRAFRLKVLNANYLPPAEGDYVSVDASLDAGGQTLPVDFSGVGRGLYETAFLPAVKGRNRLKVVVKMGKAYIGSAESVFEVAESPVFTPSDEETLKKTAALMGGGYYHLDPDKGPDELLKNLPSAREGRREASRFDPDTSLSVMLFAAALFILSWILGRLKGLP